jgi:hypothetical protein
LTPVEVFAACAISAFPFGLSAWSTCSSARGAANAIAAAMTPKKAR